MNEAETRTEHIDPALAAAGWGKGRWQPRFV
jgi:type I site-specific restriction endonuclease